MQSEHLLEGHAPPSLPLQRLRPASHALGPLTFTVLVWALALAHVGTLSARPGSARPPTAPPGHSQHPVSPGSGSTASLGLPRAVELQGACVDQIVDLEHGAGGGPGHTLIVLVDEAGEVHEWRPAGRPAGLKEGDCLQGGRPSLALTITRRAEAAALIEELRDRSAPGGEPGATLEPEVEDL